MEPAQPLLWEMYDSLFAELKDEVYHGYRETIAEHVDVYRKIKSFERQIWLCYTPTDADMQRAFELSSRLHDAEFEMISVLGPDVPS